MDITLAVGQDVSISQEGYGMYILDSEGPVTVELRQIGGQVIDVETLSAGQGLSGMERFEEVRIRNKHTSAQTVVLYVGQGRFVDNRNVGVVSISGTVSVDPVPLTTNNKYGWGLNSNTGVGTYGYAELHNPAASGVVLVVEAMKLKRQSLNVFAYYKYSSPASPTPTTTQTTPLQGSGASKATMSAVTGRASGYTVEYSSSAATAAYAGNQTPVTEALDLESAVTLLEGESIVAVPFGTNEVIQGMFIWEERPNV